jgi:hypothetical protein
MRHKAPFALALLAVTLLATSLSTPVGATSPEPGLVLRFTAPGAEPRQRPRLSNEHRLAARSQAPTATLAVPFYAVDAADFGGITTLVAVRNGTTGPVGIEIAYLPAQGGVVFEHVVLEGRETWPRNLRDVPGLPVTFGNHKLGWATITAYDLETLEDLDEPVIYGDTFVAEPGQNFATGQQLGPVGQECFFWDSRFLTGAPFDETEFRVTMPFKTGLDFEEVAVVGVWDEAGDYYGDVTIEANVSVGVLTAQEILDVIPGAPATGTFEWEFLDLEIGGFITQSIYAEGRFAVGLTPACVDVLFGL